MPKIFFLYTELAGYTLSCLQHLVSEGFSVHVVRWPLHPEAPFQFQVPAEIKLYNRNDFDAQSLLQLVIKEQPQMIICSGWADKAYIEVIKNRKGKCITVLGMDNQWKGTPRQHLARIAAPFILKPLFNYCWVPGIPQRKYARLLGFKEEDIFEGIYAADHDKYNRVFQKNKESRKEFPHRFLFVGRMVESKGIIELLEAFEKLQSEEENDWELWCAGVGNLENKIPPRDDIKYFGFIQPQDLPDLMGQCGVFILPSRNEPWGVVVQEAAAGGMPLILSNEVGAASAFLVDKLNGFIFESGNSKSLKSVMKKIVHLPDESLRKMGEESSKLSASHTPEAWSGVIHQMLNTKMKKL